MDGVCKRFGPHPVLEGVTLSALPGSITALLGASGSGKTTLLRLIAGFDRADDGTIEIGGALVEGPGRHVPPERRRVGYVPQEGALFPHLTVAGNVGYGLDRAGRRGSRVTEVLRLTGLQDLTARYPNQLSGGQQQRTALARALAPQPSLVLLDEPFNALDRELRASVCLDVTAALRVAGATAILVTHDPQEAFASADQVAVMRAGRIVQCDTPETVYRRPTDLQVARLTGPVLVLRATLEAGVAHTPLGMLQTTGGDGLADILVRPEQVVLSATGAPATVTSLAFRGDHTLVMTRAGDLDLPVNVLDAAGLSPGSGVRLGVFGLCPAYAAVQPG